MVLCSRCPGCARGAVLQSQLFFAPAGANRCRRMKPLRRPTVSTLSLATVVAPTALSLIGCTILRAVSGILRTQCGRCGSGPRETSCNRHVAHLLALVARPSPSWLNYRPCGSALAPVAQLPPLWLSSRPCGSALAPVAQLSPPWLSSRPCGSTTALVALLRSPSPLWLNSLPLWLNSPSPGRRRRLATSHGPWAVCLGSSLPCQIKPGPSVAATVIGVQREAGLGWQGLRVATG
jgi:hypothetical protein